MGKVTKTKRLDHLGLVMGTIREFNVIELVDEKLGNHEQNHVTTGEAVAAMVLNGLGFVSRPLSLTPQFFATKALDILFGHEIEPEDLNRHRLGRVLDQIHEYGCELLFSQISTHICNTINLDQTFTSLDTTSFSVFGKYDSDSDQHEIKITHGYSKAHRPDLKQAMLELVTSQDGGIPLMMRCLDGNASDNKVFQARCRELITSFQQSEGLRYLVGDSKVYHQDNIENLSAIKFITRIPKTYQEEKKAVEASIANDKWLKLNEENQYYEHKLNHLGIEQRWFVMNSKAANTRAETSINRAIAKEFQAIEKILLKLGKQEFVCELDAKEAFKHLLGKFTYHELILNALIPFEKYQGVGRPKKDGALMKRFYRIQAIVACSVLVRQAKLVSKSAYVIGTNSTEKELSPSEVIEAYKNQNASIERGFRFLKDPQFFVSSFYLKKPSRIMSLLMIMTLSLLLYSAMQRHLRKVLKEKEKTLPNQINQEIKNPTMRWIFQIMEGVDVVYTQIKDKIQREIMGITQLREKIIRLFYPPVCSIYFPNKS